ncbi:acyl-CoA dehydrogenase family protein [Mycolicibacterium komossense]|uniref:Acyl-CoA dehydrogenase n=1 Tax=Mycolicibacterium komossense TaxID=1779 RepID=A0ABT3C863_9MYCO|nr:acyl-CoA dehydrogenase family protein [Mycolicibacterium komossense]MCV7225655.1 acyl-CoA dehydrogenase [Mycolicibacterium komossense]
MSDVLAGGVFAGSTGDDDTADLRALVDDIGSRSFEARLGRRGLPEKFDDTAWGNLEDTGLTRLTTTPDLGAGPIESAVLLRGLARHAVAAPIAETDLLAAWLAAEAGVEVSETGPLTVVVADATVTDGRVIGSAARVPWTRAASTVVLAIPIDDGLLVGAARPDDLTITDGCNLGGEPRDDIEFELFAEDFLPVGPVAAKELTRRGAWARCVQIIGALDAAAELSVAYTRDRVQFGRPLSKFQAVQHSLAGLAGEIERARAATTLAVMAAADHGFAAPQTDYAVTVAKVVLGRVVPVVNTIAHQLHGAIGVTIEHQLWSSTNRAHSWIDEFGSTGHYARRLGRAALDAPDGELWDVLTGAR